jgi:pre-mRNA cleavage complex 2 protein Pcf11/serine/threonine-protein kinase CTR1
MVPADESQIICALCGEQFDDMYSIDKGEWMYKGAVHYDYSKVCNRGGSMESQECAPIVHARCMPRIPNNGMEMD